MAKILGVILLLAGCCTAESKGGQHANCTDTAQNIDIAGDDDYANINCQNTKAEEWSKLGVTVTTKSDAGLTLHFKSLQNLDKDTKLQIFANETLIHEGAVSKEWIVPTGTKQIRLSFERGSKKTATISVEVHQKCQAMINSDSLIFPMVPNKAVKGATGKCLFNITVPSVIEFDKFALANGSSLEFQGDMKKQFPDKITSKPGRIYIAKRIDFSVTLNLTDPTQNVSYTRADVGGEACGEGMLDVTKEPKTLTIKGGSDGKVTKCVWIVSTAASEKISLKVNGKTLTHVQDSFSAVDGGDLNQPILSEVNAMTKALPVVISSSRYMTMAMTFLNDPAESLNFTVSSIVSGGHLRNEGNFTLNASSDFVLSTNESMTIHVNFKQLATLRASQTIKVYSDSSSAEPLVEFNKDLPPFDITGAGTTLRVNAVGFEASDNATLNFLSVPQGSGCSRTFLAPSANDMQILANCSGEATWFIKPDVSDQAVLLKIIPNNVEKVKITTLDRNKKSTIEANSTAEPFAFAYDLKESRGVLVKFTGNDFRMSYRTSSQAANVFGSSSGNLTISSPSHPDIYPQGLIHTSVVTSKSEYLVSYKDIDLLPGSSVNIWDGAAFHNLTDSVFPADFLLKGDKNKTITLMTGDTSKISLAGARGYSLQLTPTADSKEFEGESSAVDAPEKKCDKTQCVYIINLASLKPKDANASVAVNLTVPMKNSSAELSVWDGESIMRSKMVTPLMTEKGLLYSSMSNQLIVVYRGSASLNMSYVKAPCSYADNSMCLKSKMCAPLSWRCNGVPECPDGSDEFECHNGVPPSPPPVVSPSSGWKTAFWLCMPIFVLLGVAMTKVAPIVLQKMRDSRYQQFHDLGEN